MGVGVLIDRDNLFIVRLVIERARVEVVLGRFKAGESLEDLTAEFGVPSTELIDALRVHTDVAA